MAATRPGIRRTAAALAISIGLVAAACAAPTGPSVSQGVDPTGAPASSTARPTLTATATATPESTAGSTSTPTPTPGTTSGFVPIDMFTGPSSGPGSAIYFGYGWIDGRRPVPVQSLDWMTAKSLGRVTLSAGAVTTLDPVTDPTILPSGKPLPPQRTLDTSWTRWIVEPPGYGRDEKGTRYSNLSYWNLCGPGATAVVLYYWQQVTGHPDVTGTKGYFLDPYAAEGAPWPSPGPTVAVSGGKPIGTYWSGSDTVSGFTAHARGFVMYLAMDAQPPIWQATGIAVFADGNGKALYPTRGASRASIQTGLNWEISGHDPGSWTTAWYASVSKADPTLARDLQMAVMLDVGRDGVPVMAAVDTHELPNWQAGSKTPHTRHAVAIVGYDNTSRPPTYTYLDTCGRACNSRGGNQNGQVHVIAQSAMVAAILDDVGSGFVW
jgi:hypothetical protein